MYEFTFPADDICNVISDHPNKLEFIGGFNSGTIRVFDIQNTSILQEIHAHDCPVVFLNYSHDGTRMIAADKKSYYKLYDTLSSY